MRIRGPASQVDGLQVIHSSSRVRSRNSARVKCSRRAAFSGGTSRGSTANRTPLAFGAFGAFCLTGQFELTGSRMPLALSSAFGASSAGPAPISVEVSYSVEVCDIGFAEMPFRFVICGPPIFLSALLFTDTEIDLGRHLRD